MIISWGKPEITVTALADTGGVNVGAIPTPVEDSTELSTEKGDKKEATVEGGGNEAIKYLKSKYSLKFQIRQGKGRSMPIEGKDGVVPGEYAVSLTPEEVGAPGFAMARAVCSYEDTYKAADGLMRTYTFDSLEPTDGSAQISFGNTKAAPKENQGS